MLRRNTLRFAVGEMGSRVPLLMLELTLARVLGPATYGIWSVVQTLATYGNFLHLGVASSLTRREPGLIAKGQRVELRANRAAAYGFQSLVVAAVVAAYFLLREVLPAVPARLGGFEIGLAVIVVIFAQQITITAQSSALNEYFVSAAAAARLVFAFIFLGLGLLAARTERPILWLTLAWSLALVAGLVMLRALSPGVLTMPALDLRRSRALLVDGFPIMLQGLLRFGLMSIDRLAVFLVASPQALGFYGIGSLGAGVTGLFGAMVARVSLPTILRLRVRSDATPEVVREFDRLLKLIQVLTVAVVLPVCAFSPLFLHLFLPAYKPAVWTIGFLALAGGFTGMGQALNDVAMSLGIKGPVLMTTVSMLLLESILVVVAWFSTRSIEGVAFAVLCTMAILSWRGAWLAFVSLGLSASDGRHRLIVLVAYSVSAAAVCFGALSLQERVIELLSVSLMPVFVFNALTVVVLVGGVRYALKASRWRTESE